jgi:hypothetical protein
MRHFFTGLKRTLTAGLLALALASCSGGGAGDPNFLAPAGITTASVSGSVSDSTFVAVDASSNAEVGRVAASTAGAGPKSFSLPLPAGRSYKFYLIENAGSPEARLFPLYQGAANRFSISAVTTVDLGSLSTATGIALASKDPTKVGGVSAAGEDRTVPANLAAAAFSSADLQGSWSVLQIVGGANPRWVRGTVAIDAAGTAPAAVNQSSVGSGSFPSASYSIKASGMVSFASGITGGFQGIMTRDRGMIVGNYTPDAGDYGLVLMVKSGGAFAQSDLQGSWSYHRLQVGAASGWSRGSVSIDGSGAAIFTGASNSGEASSSTGLLEIDAAGFVSDPGQPEGFGVLSPDKNLLVTVGREPGGAASLTVLVRSAGASFSGADYQGIWRMNWLTAGSSSNWGRTLLVLEASGAAAQRSTLLSYGSAPDSALTLDLFSDGGVQMADTDFSGFLSPGKDVLVGTRTDGTGFSLCLLVK